MSGQPARKKARKLSPIREPASGPKQLKPYFNPLPVPPQKQRPCLLPFFWGTGNFGQFGMGPGVLGEVSKPKRNTWIEERIEDGVFGEDEGGIESVACGGLHTIFLDERGTLWSCGVNDDAALGRVTKDVPDPDNPNSFLSVDELTSIPHPLQTLVDAGFRAVKVVAGDSICAALSDQGELRVWGSFRVNEGSLGFSDGLKHQFIPTVPALELGHKPGDIEKVSSIASGGNHLLVLTTHGNVYSWGAGEQSQLGRRVIARRKIHGTIPERITLGTRGRKAVIIGAGAYHSFAVDETGDIWGWGLFSMGQTGTGYISSEDSVVQLPKKSPTLKQESVEWRFCRSNRWRRPPQRLPPRVWQGVYMRSIQWGSTRPRR
jgi:regulator of chromosome condensation